MEKIPGTRKNPTKAFDFYGKSTQSRCGWCTSDLSYIQYHDEEWGVPLHNDQSLFELLILEGAQAGLSWLTILRRRDHYRDAFAQFQPKCVAQYTETDVARLRQDAGIIRNTRKIHSAIQNARAFLATQAEFVSFDHYLWRFVDGEPIQNTWKTLADVPASTALSEQLSKDLKQRGFSFVGPTICYAFMQAAGMVNDHTTDCFRHTEIAAF